VKWALLLHCLDGVRISKVPCASCGALVRPGRAGLFQVPMLCSETLSQLGLWCADIGFNANVTIEELGSPDKIIQGFAPELYGSPLSVRSSGSCPSRRVCATLPGMGAAPQGRVA